jgi:hypothetical protein
LDSPLQTRYATNLTTYDAVLNITNTGASGSGTAGENTANLAATTGAICVNVYAMAPDEQEVSCCSCPVTPDALVSLSVQGDLLSNTLTPAKPTSVVIRMYATLPVAGSCAGSAALTTATAAPGLAAWGTTTHATAAAAPPVNGVTVTPTAPGVAGVTVETAFTPSTVNASELFKLQSFCSFAISNGSGFGICNSCRLGGLGASFNSK